MSIITKTSSINVNIISAIESLSFFFYKNNIVGVKDNKDQFRIIYISFSIKIYTWWQHNDNRQNKNENHKIQ